MVQLLPTHAITCGLPLAEASRTRPQGEVTAGRGTPAQPHRGGSKLADRIAAALAHHEPGWRLLRYAALARRHNVSTCEAEMAVGELISRHVVGRLPDGQLPLGTTAHKQGRMAGGNALGRNREFAGSLGTRVVKIFDQTAPTGPRDHGAKAAGFDPVTVAPRPMTTRLTTP